MDVDDECREEEVVVVDDVDVRVAIFLNVVFVVEKLRICFVRDAEAGISNKRYFITCKCFAFYT